MRDYADTMRDVADTERKAERELSDTQRAYTLERCVCGHIRGYHSDAGCAGLGLDGHSLDRYACGCDGFTLAAKQAHTAGATTGTAAVGQESAASLAPASAGGAPSLQAGVAEEVAAAPTASGGNAPAPARGNDAGRAVPDSPEQRAAHAAWMSHYPANPPARASFGNWLLHVVGGDSEPVAVIAITAGVLLLVGAYFAVRTLAWGH